MPKRTPKSKQINLPLTQVKQERKADIQRIPFSSTEVLNYLGKNDLSFYHKMNPPHWLHWICELLLVLALAHSLAMAAVPGLAATLGFSRTSQSLFTRHHVMEFRTSEGWQQELDSVGHQCSGWVPPSFFLSELTFISDNSLFWPEIAFLRPKLSRPWQLWWKSEEVLNLTALSGAFELWEKAGAALSLSLSLCNTQCSGNVAFSFPQFWFICILLKALVTSVKGFLGNATSLRILEQFPYSKPCREWVLVLGVLWDGKSTTAQIRGPR